MHRPETEKDAAPLGTPVYSPAGTDGIWTKGISGGSATQVDEEFLNDWTENVFEVLDRGGVAATKGRKEDLADAIGNLVGQAQKGLVLAHFQYVSASKVELREYLKGDVFVEVDGVIANGGQSLTFDMATDLSGTEAASTWYYAYVRVIATDQLNPLIDVLGPEITANKIGYHPTSTHFRFIGAFYNDASSNIVPFDASRTATGWETRFRKWPFGENNPGTAVGGNYFSLSLSGQAPITAREVLLFIWGVSGDRGFAFTHYAIDRDLPKTVADDGGQAHVANASNGAETTGSDNVWVPLDDPTSPSVAWAITGTKPTHVNAARVIGWR